MIRMTEQANFRPTAEAKGFLDRLKDNHVFSRAVDGYAFAAAMAIKENLDISNIALRNRTDLVAISTLDDLIRLALESGVTVLQKRKQLPTPTDGGAVIELVTRYAEAGITLLRERWDGKTSLQIQHDIKRLIAS